MLLKIRKKTKVCPNRTHANKIYGNAY